MHGCGGHTQKTKCSEQVQVGPKSARGPEHSWGPQGRVISIWFSPLPHGSYWAREGDRMVSHDRGRTRGDLARGQVPAGILHDPSTLATRCSVPSVLHDLNQASSSHCCLPNPLQLSSRSVGWPQATLQNLLTTLS